MKIVYIGLLVFFASFFGTVTGFGTSTILIPAVSLFGQHRLDSPDGGGHPLVYRRLGA